MAGPKFDAWYIFHSTSQDIGKALTDDMSTAIPDGKMLRVSTKGVQQIHAGLREGLQQLYERIERLHQKIDRIEKKIGSV